MNYTLNNIEIGGAEFYYEDGELSVVYKINKIEDSAVSFTIVYHKGNPNYKGATLVQALSGFLEGLNNKQFNRIYRPPGKWRVPDNYEELVERMVAI
jgi:hypothetical protein